MKTSRIISNIKILAVKNGVKVLDISTNIFSKRFSVYTEITSFPDKGKLNWRNELKERFHLDSKLVESEILLANKFEFYKEEKDV